MASSAHTNWSRKSLEELEELYTTEISRALRRAGYDPNIRPSYEELQRVGYGGLARALRRDHNTTLQKWCTTELGLRDRESTREQFTWNTTDEETIQLFERFLEAHNSGWEYATYATNRARLNKYATAYTDANPHHSIPDALHNPEHKPDDRARVRDAIAVLDSSLAATNSKRQYFSTINAWYEWLHQEGIFAYNPADGIQSEFSWNPGDPQNQPLTSEDVHALYHTAETTSQRLLIIGLAAWGLRRSELAALHQDQLVLHPSDGETPYIQFQTRKNGPSQVNILYGIDVLTTRLEELQADPDWNGYLFPSPTAASGHRIGDTIYDRFQRLAETAGVTVNGEPPKPHMGRRFWYEAYQEVIAELVAALRGVAMDQGSDDVATMARHYHSPEARRRARHNLMAQELEDTFGGLIDRSPGIDTTITGGRTRGEDVLQGFQPEGRGRYAVRHPRGDSDTARTLQAALTDRRDRVAPHHRLLGIDQDGNWHHYDAIAHIITVVDGDGHRIHREALASRTSVERWLAFIEDKQGLGWDVLLEQRDAHEEFATNPLPGNNDHRILGIDGFGRWLHYNAETDHVIAINWAGGIDARIDLPDRDLDVNEFLQLVTTTIGWIDQKAFSGSVVHDGLQGFDIDIPEDLFGHV